MSVVLIINGFVANLSSYCLLFPSNDWKSLKREASWKFNLNLLITCTFGYHSDNVSYLSLILVDVFQLVH